MRSLVLAGLLLSPALLASRAHADDEAPPLSIYGFARLDVLVDDSRMSNVANPDFVMLEPSTGRLDGELTMTPRLSRLGLGIDKWDLDDNDTITGEGKLEIDFAGGTGVDAIRLRHAYGAVHFGRKNLVQILAGQTWDLVSPLFPSVQNDNQLRFAGNIGDRRPQVRIEGFPVDRVHFGIGAAANGVVDKMDLDGDGRLDGVASGLPMFQWILEYRQRMKGDIFRMGFSGHVASTKLADGSEQPASSVAMHLFVPASKEIIILGEGYLGQNIADLGGGVGQGVNPVQMKPVRSVGGWMEVAMLPSKRHMLAFGTSVDTAVADDVEVGDRTRNSTTYGVLRYKPRSTLQLAVEYLYWKTTYKEMGSGIANRFDMHASVFF
jgi:hypothetical protein